MEISYNIDCELFLFNYQEDEEGADEAHGLPPLPGGGEQ
jgi:hypothetical protein